MARLFTDEPITGRDLQDALEEFKQEIASAVDANSIASFEAESELDYIQERLGRIESKLDELIGYCVDIASIKRAVKGTEK